MSDTEHIRACFGFCPLLSQDSEERAHENILFYKTPGEAPDVDAQTNHVGFCTAVVYLSEQFGVVGAGRQTVEREDEVVCLHSPCPNLWLAFVADTRLSHDTEALHLLLERCCDVFQMRFGAAVVQQLTDPQCPRELRAALQSFYAQVLDYVNGCVFPTEMTEARKAAAFPYPTRTWYAVAAFEAFVGYEPYHYGGRNDVSKVALQCNTLVHRELVRHLDGPADVRTLHHALFDLNRLRVLSTSLPPHVLAQLRLHCLLLGLDKRVGRQSVAEQLHLVLDGGEMIMEVLVTHVSPVAVLVVLRERDGDLDERALVALKHRALACATDIAAELAQLLKSLPPLDHLRALPLLVAAPVPSHPDAGGLEPHEAPRPVYTGKNTFWLLWGPEGLQGCPLSELSISMARHVARVMLRVRCSQRNEAIAGEDTRDDVPDCAVTEMLGESGLLDVCRRRWDGTALAVLVTNAPRLAARFSHVAEVKATLGF